jgi:indole-3-glycerol phosphate synthase
MNSILNKIVKKKRNDLDLQILKVPVIEINTKTPYKSRFAESITKSKYVAIIAEIKLASPAHPSLGDSSKILLRAKKYETGGANAISFITEKYCFKSDTSYIPKLKAITKLPILQKDFVIDEYQIHEARSLGSDAILLIARLVNPEKLRNFVSLAQKLGVEPVVEINDETDLKAALKTTARCIAVNSRDLRTFQIDLDRACELVKQIPNTYVRLGFSGINNSDDVHKYASSGAKGILVGTSLMQAKDIAAQLKELIK